MTVLAVFLIVIGLGTLAWGSDLAVGAARSIARRLGVSPLVIGLTLTSIGTSVPEIATNLAAAVSTRAGADASGIAVGNVVGSNLSQITLLLGIVGLAGPMSVPRRALFRDGGMVLASVLLLFAVVADGRATQGEAALLVAVYAVYLVVVVVQERRRSGEGPAMAEEAADERPTHLLALRTAGGLGLVVGGAHLVVTYGVELARASGVDEAIVGLMVGLGTGLPELVVSLRALRTDGGAMSLGNLLGSNITDPLLSFGTGALVADVQVDPVSLRLDFPTWLLATTVALLALWDRLSLTRTEATTLLLLFGFWLYLRLGVAPMWAP